MTFKDEVRAVYGTDLNDDVLVNIPDQATEIIDQLINMFSLKLNSTFPAYKRKIIFNNRDNLFLNRYEISLGMIGTYGYRVKYVIRIVDYMPYKGAPTPKRLFYTVAEDFNIFYDKLSKFIEE